MHIGDWIAVSTGNINSNAVRNILQEHIDLGRNLRVIVYDHENVQESGSNANYLIKDFAVFRIWGYKLDSGGDGSWIMGEFIRWDSSCGQP
jgi:hypothetical protein